MLVRRICSEGAVISGSIKLARDRDGRRSFFASEKLDSCVHSEGYVWWRREGISNMIFGIPKPRLSRFYCALRKTRLANAVYLDLGDNRSSYWGGLCHRDVAPLWGGNGKTDEDNALARSIVKADLEFPVTLSEPRGQDIKNWVLKRQRSLILLVGQIVLLTRVDHRRERNEQRDDRYCQRPAGHEAFPQRQPCRVGSDVSRGFPQLGCALV